MTVLTSELLIIRALNSTRPYYFPSYLGVRLIGAQMAQSPSTLLPDLVSRRLFAGDAWRFKPFKLYKGSMPLGQEIVHEYRDCLAPSPITAIAESYILSLLAGSPSFRTPPRVFSYRWPSSASGGNYEYFAVGYGERNRHIAELLSDTTNSAVVTDIKSFYPSVKWAHVETVLAQRLSETEARWQYGDAIHSFYAQMFREGTGGIPIGPQSGHVLGHLALCNVDDELTRRFGNRYFRYVDDIVVVVPTDQVSAVTAAIGAILDSAGFSTNPSKTVSMSSQDWDTYLTQSDIDGEDSFRTFARDLTVYLAFHPHRASELQTLFYENNLSIPVKRLLALSKYSQFRYFFVRTFRGAMLSSVASIFSSNAGFLERAKKLKGVYEDALARLVQAPAEKGSSLHRWYVQRVRRVVNTLFYLRAFSEWKQTREIDSFSELVEQQALANALASGTVNPVLPFYPRGAAAFSEIWNEYGNGEARLTWDDKGFLPAELDSIAALQFQGTITGIKELAVPAAQRRIFEIAINDRPQRRVKPDLSYDDELESLRLGLSNAAIGQLSRSRYALREASPLEALALLVSEYVS